MYNLREHQKVQNKAVRKSLKVNDSCIFGAATGFGKAICIWDFVKRDLEVGKRVLLLAPRRQLIFQLADTLKTLDPLIVLGAVTKGNRDSNLIVSSRQTASNRVKSNHKNFQNFDSIYIDECFTPDTEVLTNLGFIRFDELPDNIKIAQVNADTQSISYVKEVRRICKPFEGELVHIYGKQSVDILCTPNHEILTYDKKLQPTKLLAKDVKKTSTKNILTSAKCDTMKKDKFKCWEKLALAYQADGSMHCIYKPNIVNKNALEAKNGKASKLGQCTLDFSFSKQRKIDTFLNDFSKYLQTEVKGTFGVGNVKAKRRFLIKNIKTKKVSKTLYDLFDISKMSYDKKVAMIDYILKWDGHVFASNSDYCSYSSIVETNVDFLQHLCVTVGYKTTKVKVIDNRSETYSDIYKLNINKSTSSVKIPPVTKNSSTYYNGDVHCVTVPEGNILIRRNGLTAIVGNCHMGGNFPPKKGSDFELLYNLYWGKAKWVGFSATPIDAKGNRLDGWSDAVYLYQTAKLIKMGFLADYDYYAPETIDLSSLKVSSMGDYTQESMNDVVLKASAITSVKKQWKKHKDNKKIIIFASSIDHATLLQQALVGSEILHSKLPEKHRNEVLVRFEKAKNATLINIDILTTGFDDPTVDCLILARPIKSIPLAIQIWGRALRLYGKKRALILDMCNVWESCGLPKDVRNYNQVKQPKGEQKPTEDVTSTCQTCKHVFKMVERRRIETIKKKYTLTKYFCPVCDAMLDEVRVDLSTVEKLVKVEEVEVIELSADERKSLITALIAEETQYKPAIIKYIARAYASNQAWDVFDQIVAQNKDNRTKMWRKIYRTFRGLEK